MTEQGEPYSVVPTATGEAPADHSFLSSPPQFCRFFLILKICVSSQPYFYIVPWVDIPGLRREMVIKTIRNLWLPIYGHPAEGEPGDTLYPSSFTTIAS